MLNKPHLTEKSFINAGNGIYTFDVTPGATKNEVKVLVESIFKVHVTKLTSVIKKARSIRTGKRRVPTQSAVKKTVRVWLKKGESIALFDIKKD